jgi:hypothetical protein
MMCVLNDILVLSLHALGNRYRGGATQRLRIALHGERKVHQLSDGAKNASLSRHFMLEMMIILPRQARDKQRENSKRDAFFEGRLLCLVKRLSVQQRWVSDGRGEFATQQHRRR